MTRMRFSPLRFIRAIRGPFLGLIIEPVVFTALIIFAAPHPLAFLSECHSHRSPVNSRGGAFSRQNPTVGNMPAIKIILEIRRHMVESFASYVLTIPNRTV